MNRESWTELTLQVSGRRWVCLPDPHLCLAPLGAALLGGLVDYADIWLGAEFISLLDAAQLYYSEPGLLAGMPGSNFAPAEVRLALRSWTRLRSDLGRAGRRLYWARDGLRESSLPDGMHGAMIPRWEAAARALDARHAGLSCCSAVMAAAMRDTAALAAVLPNAVILCVREPMDMVGPPLFCRQLHAWRVPCRHLGIDDDLVALERGLLLRLLVDAGVGGFLWSGLRLAVVHLTVPGGLALTCDYPQPFAVAGAGLPHADEPDTGGAGSPCGVPGSGLWEGVRAFWYDLRTEDPYAGR